MTTRRRLPLAAFFAPFAAFAGNGARELQLRSPLGTAHRQMVIGSTDVPEHHHARREHPEELREQAKREFGYYVLPLLVGDQLVGRAEPRFDRKTRTLEVLGAWGDTSRLDEALESLFIFLGAKDMATGLEVESE